MREDSRLYPALIAGAAIALMAGAFGFQHIGGVAPCPLCIYQRYVLAVAIVVALVALALAGRAGQGAALGLTALVFAAGAALGIFHVGVEQHWWQGTAGCVGGLTEGRSLADVLAGVKAGPAPRCDEPGWALFGITLAGYNVLASVTLAAASLYALARIRRAAP